ncbi:MAG: response regulator [Patescibacteria group bacterium]|nr:response regulator [Patescibacteria group bacterium]
MAKKLIKDIHIKGQLAMGQRKTILVIEDERPLLDAINAKLEKNGFGVITARSVEQTFNAKLEKKGLGSITVQSIEQALRYLESLERVDAIWLDHHLLGKEDGLDFVKKFKANGGRWNTIPIFVVSNAASPNTVRSYIDAGVTKYYVKSDHRLDEIIKDIRSFLDHPEK